MVKKTSFFTRLRNRWKPGSGMRVEEGSRADPGPAERPRASVGRMERDNGSRLQNPPSRLQPEARSSRKLSGRDEAMMALGEHHQQLAQLLKGVQSRIEGQGGSLERIAEGMKMLPALGNTQIEVLRRVAAHMEKQNQLSEVMTRSLGALPDLLRNVQGALDRAAATDERTAKSLREFTSNMDRIHQSMDRIVEHSAHQTEATRKLAESRDDDLKAVAGSLEHSHRQAVEELRDATDQGLASLRRTHEDQSTRLQKVLQQQAGWSRAVLAGLGVVVLGMAAVIAILVFQ